MANKLFNYGSKKKKRRALAFERMEKRRHNAMMREHCDLQIKRCEESGNFVAVVMWMNRRSQY